MPGAASWRAKADDLSDPMVIAAADWEELGHASVSLAHSVVPSHLGLTGQGDFIFAYGGVAVANTDHVNVYGRSSERQTECAPGESEIMLVQPDWFSTLGHAFGLKEGILGIDAFLFEEIAGGIPLQGECDLARYGKYFRPPPVFGFLRGVTKRHVIDVGTCEIYGIRGGDRPPMQ